MEMVIVLAVIVPVFDGDSRSPIVVTESSDAIVPQARRNLLIGESSQDQCFGCYLEEGRGEGGGGRGEERREEGEERGKEIVCSTCK